MARVKNKKKMNDDERRKSERDRKRKYREKIKLDSVKFEQVKKYDRDRKEKDKQEGNIKTINELTERQKRQQRKKWKTASSRYRTKLKQQENADIFLELNTPPNSPGPNLNLASADRRSEGKRRSRRRREKDKRKIKKLQSSLEKSKREAEKWRKRFQRLEKGECSNQSTLKSPGKLVRQIMSAGPREVRKKLLLGVGLSMQLKENSKKCKSQEEKKILAENLSGEIINRKKLKSVLEKEKIVSSYYQRHATKDRNRQRKKHKTNVSVIRDQLIGFFEDAENSCQAPGKRDYVTRNKVQKQKRYLLFSLKDLHKTFIEKTKYKISYQTFVKNKPFWVVHKKVDKRDTCLCMTHANFKYKIEKLKLLRLLKTSSTLEILKHSVCDLKNKSCMYGTCKDCTLYINEKLLNLIDFEDFNTFYYKWTSKIEEQHRKKDDKVIKVKKTVKEKVMCKATNLLEITKRDLKCIAMHTYNMRNQHEQFKKMKETLTEEESLIICDWSENYSCKYAEEVQAIHFGASRNQISLHTGVAYMKDQKFSFCTGSNSTNHGAVAIWAHLKPILNLITDRRPTVKIVHFFTDGPTSQYRNKTNFYLMCNTASYYGLSCSWNFWEAGHGKGPADGIGGLVKRTADKAVAMGHDVRNAEEFLKTIKDLKINTFLIEEDESKKVSTQVNEVDGKILPVPGTLKLKSVIWIKSSQPYCLILREHTCSICRVEQKCTHYPTSALKQNWNLISADVSYNDIGSPSNETHSGHDEECDTSSDSELNPIPNRASKKTYRFSDVYSSAESLEEEITSPTPRESRHEEVEYQVNNFVIVNFEGTIYPGVITGVRQKGYLVSVMEKSKKNWKWPIKSDEIWYDKKEVVRSINPPKPIGKRGFFSVAEIDC